MKTLCPTQKAPIGTSLAERQHIVLSFFIPALDCTLILKLHRGIATFSAFDLAGDITSILDGARIHGGAGTIAIFQRGSASCDPGALENGFQVRAAGESMQIVREPRR